MTSTLLVTPAELADELAGPNPPAVIDARWRLGGPPGIDDYVIGQLLVDPFASKIAGEFRTTRT